jgi:carboxymethylenebutenolidase
MNNFRRSEIQIDLRPERPKPMSAYLALPGRDGPFPGVVVIHEIFGLNANIRDIAERFAREGYAALAVDLFSSGNKVVCMARIVHGLLFRTLENGVVRDLQAALDFLGERPEIDPGRLGAIGFCMGGSYALQLACVSGDMHAASIFYSMNPRPLEAVAGACPIVGSFPERDWSARLGRELEAALEKTSVPHEIKIYPGARHSFFNDRGGSHHPEAAADAWARTAAFFEKHLRG